MTEHENQESLDICASIRNYLNEEERLELTSNDYNKPLNRLGLDSVAAIGLGEFISENYHVKAPQSLIFDHPSVEKIAEFILQNRKN